MSLYDVKFDKQAALNALKARGIAKATLWFSGGHDEGGVDNAEYLDAEGNPVPIDDKVVQIWQYGPIRDGVGRNSPTEVLRVMEGWKEKGGREERDPTEQELRDFRLRELVEASVYSKYHTFAGEFYVEGTVHFDVEAGKVWMDASESVEAYDSVSEEW